MVEASSTDLIECNENRAPKNNCQTGDAVTSVLRQSNYSVLRLISVECNGGTIVLRGTVPSYFMKQIAQETVRDVDGVKRTVNLITVPDESTGIPPF